MCKRRQVVALVMGITCTILLVAEVAFLVGMIVYPFYNINRDELNKIEGYSWMDAANGYTLNVCFGNETAELLSLEDCSFQVVFDSETHSNDFDKDLTITLCNSATDIAADKMVANGGWEYDQKEDLLIVWVDPSCEEMIDTLGTNVLVFTRANEVR